MRIDSWNFYGPYIRLQRHGKGDRAVNDQVLIRKDAIESIEITGVWTVRQGEKSPEEPTPEYYEVIFSTPNKLHVLQLSADLVAEFWVNLNNVLYEKVLG